MPGRRLRLGGWRAFIPSSRPPPLIPPPGALCQGLFFSTTTCSVCLPHRAPANDPLFAGLFISSKSGGHAEGFRYGPPETTKSSPRSLSIAHECRWYAVGKVCRAACERNALNPSRGPSELDHLYRRAPTNRQKRAPTLSTDERRKY